MSKKNSVGGLFGRVSDWYSVAFGGAWVGDWEKWPVVNSSGVWVVGDNFHFEKQAIGGLETNCCTVFGTLNAIELLEGVVRSVGGLGGVVVNYSDRFTATLIETMGHNGTTAHEACESVRHFGLLPEFRLPWSADITTREQYLDKGAITAEMRAEAQTIGRRLDFQHSWVARGAGGNFSEALKRSPVGVGVSAWFDRGDGVYFRPEGVPVNHYALIIGQIDGYWIVLDSYEPYIKRLAGDYQFGRAKVMRIT